ncbi:MerR family transcriptional regulator [Micromonospora sp. WMMD1102]|uniref:MerR family transcriptional regulator n=1 Tax=Micromonospora sp. WMMD1102 TaxID=3016105 RepID=UPI0024155228|nr:MerR family transcriptional regulator [Micromonospora sp. WMMD1102]MDG4790696.1 MerR family transcriptional regulator [Micromonospora sp. WMMD1102]
MADDGLSAGAVARRLGVAVTTLRSWHQRYGLGPSRHVPGRHRRYSVEDLDRLDVMARLTAEGVSPAEAAHWARAGAVPGAEPDRDVPARGAPDRDVPERGVPARGVPARAGGGAVIAVGRAGPAARGLARAAMRLDPVAMRAGIDAAIEADGVVATWDRLLRPVLVGVGERYAASAGYIEVEHLLSRCVSEALAAVPRPRAGAATPRILLCCADEEQHSLPLEALAAALAELGVPCRLLGARVPAVALVDAVRRTAPRAVVVWSQRPTTGDPAQLAAVRSGPQPPPLLVAAGPGWRSDLLPAGVRHPATLADGLAMLRDVPGSSGS